MTKINSLCVYCGTGFGASEIYHKTAADFGRYLADNKIQLVYGGGRVGLMGAVAEAALEKGGKVIGIIPEHIQTKEQTNIDVSELHIVDSMHTRKMMMAEKSDGFVVLPGGFGTLDEAFEILTWKYLKLHDKPIVFLNVNNYWDPLFAAMRHMSAEGFTPAWQLKLFAVAKTVGEVLPLLLAEHDPGVETNTRRM